MSWNYNIVSGRYGSITIVTCESWCPSAAESTRLMRTSMQWDNDLGARFRRCASAPKWVEKVLQSPNNRVWFVDCCNVGQAHCNRLWVANKNWTMIGFKLCGWGTRYCRRDKFSLTVGRQDPSLRHCINVIWCVDTGYGIDQKSWV